MTDRPDVEALTGAIHQFGCSCRDAAKAFNELGDTAREFWIAWTTAEALEEEARLRERQRFYRSLALLAAILVLVIFLGEAF